MNAEPKRRFGDEVPEEAAVHAETTEVVRQSWGDDSLGNGDGAPWCGEWSMRRMRLLGGLFCTSHYL